MSLDRRLRDGLDRLAAGIEPDVEGRLKTTLDRGHRPRLVTFALPIAATAAAVLLVAVVGPALIGLVRGEFGASTSATPSQSSLTATLVGAYAASVTPGNPAVDEHNLSGDWTIVFETSGLISVTAPTGFVGTRTGYVYEITGDQLVTDLFGSDVCTTLLPGRYRWELVGESLRFDAVDDPCAGRAALLAGQEWHVAAAE
jgi:hypothetical protein